MTVEGITNDTALLDNLEDLYPLSPMQQGMLFHSIYSPGSGVYVEQSVFTLAGEFELAVFERAWQTVVDRHAILRTSFLWEGLDNPLQAVHRQVALPVVRHDWRGHSAEDRGRQLDAFLRDDRARGFVLSQAPLMRLALIRCADQEYKFVLTRHHIVLDRWSRSLVLRDFIGAYDALVAGREPILGTARQYSDYINWLGRQDAASAERFWRASLAGFPEPTALAVARKTDCPHEPGNQYADLRTRLSEADTEKLQAFARQHRLTLNTVAQAAWALLLAHYSGTDDVLFGVSTAGRPADLPGVESIVGLLINTLPLRVSVPWSSQLVPWLQHVQECQTSLQQYQYSSLLDIHGWSEIPRNHPLFETIFIFENLPVSATKTADGALQMRSDRGYGSQTNYPIAVLVMPGTQLSIQIVFDRSRFDEATIARMLSHLGTVLQSIVVAPDQRVRDVSVLPDHERRQLLGEWNETNVEYDRGVCIHALFEAQAARTPDAVAVVADGAEEGWTYAELNRRANQLARHLQAAGVGPEVPVGIFLERSADMIVALLGVLKAGGAYVPLDPSHPLERLRFTAKDARLAIMVTRERLLHVAPVGDTRAICLTRDSEQIARQPTTNVDTVLDASNLAYLIYTSGSTGAPKGVQVEHRALTNLLCAMRVEPGLAADDVLLSITTLSFDIAALELYLPLIVGARLVIASQDTASDGTRLSQRLIETGATVMQGTPATWRMLIEAGWMRAERLRALCGGESLPRELADQVLSRVSALWNLYGPTETTIWSAVCRVGATPASVSIGRPIANTQMYILDSHFNPAPVGVAGELHIGGDGLARGYVNHPEVTAERFLPNPFSGRQGDRLYRTGDLARYRPDGSIEWLRRVDHQIKLRGFRIELGEIEAVIRSHPGVLETVVVLREDELGDPRVVAYILPADGTTAAAEADRAVLLVPALRRVLAARLPKHMIPSAFVLIDALPLTANGKINRRALPAPDDARPSLASRYEAPRNDAERILAAIWADVLKLEQIGVLDSFFELGGHSLRAMQVISRVREHFGLELPLRILFEHPTVAELAAALAGFEKTDANSSAAIITSDADRDAADRARMVPVSFAQQRLWFLSRLEPDGAAYNMSSPLRVRGPLHEASLRQTFNLLLARHEVLRGRFEVVEGQPVQVIAPRLTVDLPVVDLTAWPEAEREADVTRRLRAEAQRPFDLTQAPLLRVSLVRLAPHDHVLLLTLHHIVSDGWSMGILLREIAAIYAATVAARPVALPALPIQYADFARWQRGWLQGAVLAEQVGYWRGQLAGAPGVLDLPVARPRPAMQTMHGALVGRTLSPQVSRAVTDLSAREGVTVFMTLLATFQTLLYRYSGQEDFVVGSPIAGRDRAETEGLIGFFVNSLPLRANLAGNPSFRELLARVKETALGAYAHQGLPFERMVEELQPARSLSYPPIFQVMFALQNQPRVALTLPGLAIEPVASARDSAKFDLTLFMAERAGQLSCRLEYNTDLFAPDTATRLLQHFEVLLEGVTARPQQRVAALPLLPAAERERLLTTWNATAVALPAETGVHQRVEQQVARTADATAVVDAGTTTTYGELNRRANQLAHYLRTLGVGPEARVGIFMERSVEMIVALLGVLKAGGAYVPLDPTYPPERIRFSVADAQLAVILTDARWAATLPPSAARVVSVAAARAAGAGLSAANPVSDTVAGNLAYVIYTSGSTGQPKGVAITHGSALALVDWAGRTFTREELRGVLASTSICFDLSVFEIFVPLSVGGTVILAADALQLPVVAAQATVTLVNTVPSAMAELVRIGLPASVQTVNLAGEPLRPELVTQIYRQSAVTRVVDLYGPTEDTTYSTCAERAPDQPATIGRPIANTRAYILDGLLAPVPIGVPGELYLGGAGLARGYVGRPAATAERFLPDPFSRAPGQRLYRTGDIARYAADGTIEYLGRVDHQVKVRGYRIELGEIETVMGRHPGVRDTVVLAREDAPGDIRLVAYIVPAGSGDVAATNGLQSAQVSQWQAIWDETYRDEAPAPDPTFNVIGWNSSYTGEPIPAQEMKEWVERTVERIASLHPRRVLEIGCGTGLLLFRLAPHVEHYHGTDLSEKGLDHLRQQLSAFPERYPNVVLSRQAAHDFSSLAPAAYDTVILNSVVQYFPSVDYLVRVLEGAIALVKPGGSIFLGDLRSLRLLDAFHASVQVRNARPSMTIGELRRRVQVKGTQEKELAIDPGLFDALKSHLPSINRVEVQIKRGRYRNELSKFRYDVILHVDDEQIPRVDGPWLTWQTDVSSVGALCQMLRDTPLQVLGVADLVNARVAEDVQAFDVMISDDAPATVGELRRTVEEVSMGVAVEPEDLWALGTDLDYDVELKWSAGSAQKMDLVLRRRGAPWVELAPLDRRRKELRADEQSWTRYANNPLQSEVARTLVPQLRRGLMEELPEYMMPSAFMLLDALPLTANGKINRRALPAPGETRPELESDYVAPRTKAEELLASIWRQVLMLEQIGVHDDFFQLGGHSLLATQVVSRIRDRMQIDLPLRHLFELPTIAGLAAAIGEAQTDPEAAAPLAITRSVAGAAADLLDNLDQLTDEQVEMLLNEALRDNAGN